MKKILSFLFLFLSMILQAQELPIKNQDVSPKQLQKQNKEIVKLVAKELSKNLPQTIDKYTKIVSIKAEDTTIVYTFEINTGVKSDEAIMKEDHSKMKNALIKGTCRSSKRFMNALISKRYVYKSAISKKILFQVNVSQADCIKIFGPTYYEKVAL